MKVLVILTLFWTWLASSREDPFLMRVSWVKAIQKLVIEIEKKHPKTLTTYERSFLEKFSLIEIAHADSRFSCFYGGWPSVLKSGKCQHPKEYNPDYRSEGCSSNQFQCHPLLFGEGLCVNQSSTSVSNDCESQFKSRGLNLNFLKHLSRQQQERLREMSLLAREICGSNHPQGSVDSCHDIKQKFQSALRSLEHNPDDLGSAQSSTMLDIAKSLDTHPADCNESSHPLVRLLSEVARISESLSPVEKLYQEIKKDFLNSPLCDAHKILNDPLSKPSPLVVAKFMKELDQLKNFQARGVSAEEALSELETKFRFSSEVRTTVVPQLKEWALRNRYDEQGRMLLAQIRGILLQEFLAHYEYDPTLLRGEIEEDLVGYHIFSRNSEGRPECPFVSKDAFLKAFGGHQEVLKSHGSSVRKKNQITIVDYSRPSNERRMFTIDLSSKKVLHNTWVAHGAGDGSQTAGSDGLGGSPIMSNTPGSRLSSDGFILATSASQGALFGPNVLLRGIDRNNTNLSRRSVIIHKWNSPFSDYSVGTQDYDPNAGTYGASYDAINRIRSMDFRRESLENMEAALKGVKSSTWSDQKISGTEGCLGVPDINIKHLDTRGRNLTQLEALRQDLPGSVIFNYSGPEMRSNFF
jgi:hypothetical protein